MSDLILTDALRSAAERCIWFEKPEQAMRDAPRLAAYILTYGMPADTDALLSQIGLEGLRDVLDRAPAGVFDARSWAYWNLLAGRYTPPLMPRRRLAD